METRDGVIRSIVVKNFLCHKYLKVDFEKSIKFVVGHNGSGKSAILDALILGLGGAAYHTHRYPKIECYIRTGAEFASIEIKMKNSGQKAYKHGEYGDIIKIVREITKSSSRYKIYSASDQEISRKHSEVINILRAHNIQMDNPVSVLPQKVTKEFNDLSDEQKYKFYKRATNLAQSEENYDKALECCLTAEKIWKDKKRTCQDFEVELKKWEKIMANIVSKEKNQAEKMELKRELNWSKIYKLEQEVEKKQKYFKIQYGRWLQEEEQLKTKNIDNSGLKELEDKLKSKIEEKKLIENEKKELDSKISKLSVENDNIRKSQSKISNIIDREKEKVKDFEKQIQDIMSGSAARRHEEAASRAEAARNAVEETRARLATAAADAANADADCDHAARLLRDAQTDCNQLTTKIERLSQQEREAQRGADSLAGYGASAVRLRERVRAAIAARRFLKPPRGPVGAYLSVLDEKWSSALEYILGNAINNYCVDNSKDASTLFSIIDEVYTDRREKRPGVSCGAFMEKYNVRAARPPPGSPARCALHALAIKDAVVYNHLVDELALETVLLVETDEQAMRLCRPREAVPPGCARVVTEDCSEYLPAPRYRCYGGEARPVQFLHASAEAALARLRAQAAEARAARAEAEAALSERRCAHDAASARREKARHEERSLRMRLQRAEEALRHCQDDLQQSRTPQLQDRQEEMNISQQKLTEAQQKKDDIVQQEKNISEKIKEASAQLRDVKAKLNSISDTIKDIVDALEKMKLDFNQKKLHLEGKKSRCNEKKNLLDQMKQKLDSELPVKKNLIQQLIAEATPYGPRIENPRSVETLESLLQDKEAELSSFMEEEYDREQVLQQLESTREKYSTVSSYLTELEHLIRDMKNTVKAHQRSCLLRLNSVSLLVQNRFKGILTMRRIQGKLHIDDVSKKLWFDQGGRQASGGERTFALVAFLVALQDCVDLPFFFMDEFNVFLDGVNYKKAVELLLEAARMRPECQYVFITPNEPPGLRASNDLDIQTMSALVEQN